MMEAGVEAVDAELLAGNQMYGERQGYMFPALISMLATVLESGSGL